MDYWGKIMNDKTIHEPKDAVTVEEFLYVSGKLLSDISSNLTELKEISIQEQTLANFLMSKSEISTINLFAEAAESTTIKLKELGNFDLKTLKTNGLDTEGGEFAFKRHIFNRNKHGIYQSIAEFNELKQSLKHFEYDLPKDRYFALFIMNKFKKWWKNNKKTLSKGLATISVVAGSVPRAEFLSEISGISDIWLSE